MNKKIKLSNLPEYSVSEISNLLKNIVEDSFSFVKIRGEISGLKKYPSGHIYFNIKDENAVLNAVCFKGSAAKLSFSLEEGMEIIASGNITIYQARSNYQLIVKQVEMAGEGALLALLEKRKKQYQAEGLFEKNQEIAKFPKKIALITSESGSVFHDICHRIKERFPLEILLYSTAVQGKGAEINIANAISYINELDDEDISTIIIARGGGSIEDLWCFNEEVVVRSAFDSKIPIISAIGHETDFTLLDFVADLRAPTPTAAAEMATPNMKDLQIEIESKYKLLTEYFSKKLLENSQKLDFSCERLSFLMHNKISFYKERLSSLKINKALLTRQIEAKLENIKFLEKGLESNLKHIIAQKRNSINSIQKLLRSFDYKNVLKRGYALVTNNKSEIVSNAKDAEEYKELNIKFFDNTIKVKN